MPKRSNVSLLTEGAAYFQRAKKARAEQVEEIKFDDSARREYLTGFSKRKKQKIEGRRQRAQERDSLAHKEAVRKARKELQERAEQNERSVREALGLSAKKEESDDADDDNEEENIIEAEFSDDEQAATVTITEDFDPASAAVRTFVDSEDEAAGSGDEGEESKPAKVSKAAVPLLPASSRRAELRAKREKDKAALAKLNKKKDEKKSTSMETPAEKRRGKEIEQRKRQKKIDKDKARGIEPIRRSSGGARGGKGSKGAKGAKGAKGGKAAAKGKGRR